LHPLAQGVATQAITADSGIFGAFVKSYGNQPASAPPPSECIRVLDSSGKKLIATGVCGGIYAAFRVPLPPGNYLIEVVDAAGTPSGANLKSVD
jgi:hypothetical protein